MADARFTSNPALADFETEALLDEVASRCNMIAAAVLPCNRRKAPLLLYASGCCNVARWMHTGLARVIKSYSEK